MCLRYRKVLVAPASGKALNPGAPGLAPRAPKIHAHSWERGWPVPLQPPGREMEGQRATSKLGHSYQEHGDMEAKWPRPAQVPSEGHLKEGRLS